MDIKIHGLTRPIIEEAVARTKEARFYIIDEVMNKAIAEPRPEVGKYAPKIIQMNIDPTEDWRCSRSERKDDQRHH